MSINREIVPQRESFVGRENVYTCSHCGGFTVTIDIDDGTTPFMMLCRASGKKGDCNGIAYSACYPSGPRPANIPEPAWEWFKPSKEEYEKLSDQMKAHVDMGGLDLRKRAAVRGAA